MNSAIQNTIGQYFLAFAEKVSGKHNIPKEDLEELWRETQKEKLKISPRKRVSNPNKKPSAYINFCKHHRQLIKEENPALTFGEVAKALGVKWKSLDAGEKGKYADPDYVGGATPLVEEKKPKRARKSKE